MLLNIEIEMKKPFYQLEQSRDVIRHFTPNWFTATMGTGVVAMILAQLPFASALLFKLATQLWQLNILQIGRAHV